MVGYTLRQERERQNLSVSDIEQGTSIRTAYIEAIENGEYDKLPGKVYTKGFVKNYAKFLGLDTDVIAKEFAADMHELEATPEPEPEPNAAESAQAPEKPVEVKPAKPERKPLGHSIQEESRFPQSKLIVAAVVLLAILAGSAWAFLSSSDDDVAKVNPPAPQEQPATPEPPPAENPTPVAQANPAPAPKPDVVAVQARFNDRCWALVTVDGAVVQEGVIEGGQTISWEGKENISFRLGNAGAVEFFQDGKSLGVQGAVGDVVDKTFTRS